MVVKTLGIDRAGEVLAERAIVARVQRLRALVHDTDPHAPRTVASAVRTVGPSGTAVALAPS